MPYSTPFELRAAVSSSGGSDNPSTDPTGTAADLPNATLLDAIAEADSTIEAYIGGRYTVPIPPSVNGNVPHPLDYWSRNIAAYLATLTARQGQDFADTDPIARRYTATMLALTAVRDGKATLPPPINQGSGDEIGSSEGAGAPFQTYEGLMFVPDDFALGYDNSIPRWWT